MFCDCDFHMHYAMCHGSAMQTPTLHDKHCSRPFIQCTVQVHEWWWRWGRKGGSAITHLRGQAHSLSVTLGRCWNYLLFKLPDVNNSPLTVSFILASCILLPYCNPIIKLEGNSQTQGLSCWDFQKGANTRLKYTCPDIVLHATGK